MKDLFVIFGKEFYTSSICIILVILFVATLVILNEHITNKMLIMRSVAFFLGKLITSDEEKDTIYTRSFDVTAP